MVKKELTESTKGNKGNSKLRKYKEYKQDFKIESYITCISVRAHRIALTKLRTSLHQLRIETGRYQKLKEADQKCLLCNSLEVESEIHFLTQCPFLEKKRKTFYTFVSKIISDFNTLDMKSQFMKLMTCESEIILKKFGQFVFGS